MEPFENICSLLRRINSGDFTKEEAVRLHRFMYRWIARKVKKEKNCNLIYLRNAFFEKIGQKTGIILKIHEDCFCCHYVMEFGKRKKSILPPCLRCPIDVKVNKLICPCLADESLLMKIARMAESENIDEVSQLALEIARLPVRETLLSMI